MAYPDYDQYLGEIWGWPDDGTALSLAGSINIVVGTNPPYTSNDFYAFYPKFAAQAGSPPIPLVPLAVVNAYITAASASLMQGLWKDMWPIAMSLFVAHFVTLYIQSDGTPASTPGQIAAQGLAFGIQTSKAVADVSVSVQVLSDLDGWASWTLTSYGQQLATWAKTLGSRPFLLW